MTIRAGIGGWTFEPWRGVFYPEGLPQAKELAFAAGQLRTLEINGTFYRTPSAKSCADWARQVPDGFVFALKATRYVTHRRVLAEAGESVAKFIGSGITEMGDRLGPINWQFAPTKAFDADDFSAFLALLPGHHEGVRLRHAVEVRHPSFACAEFVTLARTHNVAIVYADHASYPAIADVTADFAYARLQSARETEETGYDAAELSRWATAAGAWAKGDAPEGLPALAPPAKAGKAGKAGRDVFIYLINGAKVRAPAGAMALQKRIDGTA